MRALLDTHAFLWWVTDDERLTANARAAIADGGNEILFSVVSAWEIVVKATIGRLEVEGVIGQFVPSQIEANAFQVLPVHLRHALRLAELPEIHGDPFDRMLVAQAVEEDLCVISGDRLLADYPVPLLW